MAKTSDVDFTDQDRTDVKNILTNLFLRVIDEFDDCHNLRGMYSRYAKFIVTAAMIGDEAFGDHITPELAKRGIVPGDDLAMALTPSLDDDLLQQACKRILGSGRFDFYEDD